MRKTVAPVTPKQVMDAQRLSQPYASHENVVLSQQLELIGLLLVEIRDALTSEAAAELGKLGGAKGGRARAEKLSPERRKEIAKIGARIRWGDRLEAE